MTITCRDQPEKNEPQRPTFPRIDQVWRVGWRLTALLAQTADIVQWTYERPIWCRARDKYTHTKTKNETEKDTKALFDLVFVVSPGIGVIGGVLLANHLASTDK